MYHNGSSRYENTTDDKVLRDEAFFNPGDLSGREYVELVIVSECVSISSRCCPISERMSG